ncbi:MAG: hypothetical protein ACRED1_04220, partial [Limisphaerales bacterium]
MNKTLSITITLALIFFCAETVLGNDFSAGPLFDQFPLTTGSGHRTEILGPLYYNEHNDSENIWGFPPFFSHQEEPAIGEMEDESFYPVFTYVKYGTQYRAQFFQFFTFAGGENPNNVLARRFWLFPVYFQQRSSRTNDNYTAVFP